MADEREYMDLIAQWHDKITLISVDDDVLAGQDGIWTRPIKEIAENMLSLKIQVDAIIAALDEVNGEVIEPDVATKLAALIASKQALIQALRDKGVNVPDDIRFADLGNLISEIESLGTDISDVVFSPRFNPGTQVGGISWTDPTMDFEWIEIFEVSGTDPVSVAQVAPGVQFWEPEEGEHKYRLRARLASGGYSFGVELPLITFEIVYTATLQSITVPMAAANQIVLVFDNFVKITDADGFSISGVDDEIVFFDQPDNKTIRLKLATKFFTQHGTYSLDYDPDVGNVLQNNDEPIAPITGHVIDNYADYAPAEFVDAQIPQEEPSTLVLIMSRPIRVTDISGFTLNGTSAQIKSVISDGVTVEFELDEPVDSVEVEPVIKLSFDGTGVTDDIGQAVEPFENMAVTNNSTNLAMSIESVEVPANNSRSLIVIMEGAVSMDSAVGFSLTSQNQDELPDLSESAFDVSDGTITFTLDVSLLAGKSFVLAYDGTGTLRSLSNNDKVLPFSMAVVNNSTDVGGIGPSTNLRNLAFVVLGHEVTGSTDVNEIINAVSRTIKNGNIANLVVGDYFGLASLNIAAGSDSGGAFSATLGAISGGSYGRNLDFVLVAKDPYYNKNGNTSHHVYFQSRHVLSAITSVMQGGHYMNSTNTNVGGYVSSRGRAFVKTQVAAGLQAAGIPLNDTTKILPISRRVANGGSDATGANTITDNLTLLTEFEVFGTNVYSSTTYESATTQTHFSAYYSNDTSRIKRKADGVAVYWWEASPYASYTTNFCVVITGGTAGNTMSTNEYGIAPAFAVG